MDSAQAAYGSQGMLAKRLQRYVEKRGGVAAARRCGLDPAQLRANYERRLARYMGEVDFGPDANTYTCYLNVFTGLVAYELLREAGFTEQEAFRAFDYMSAPLRRVAHVTHRVMGALPHGFSLVKRSLLSDLTGPKRVCWSTVLLRNTDDVLEYKITRCLYYDVCKAHGYPEFTRAFCDHDDFAYGGFRRHVRFTRMACLGDGDDCCHDKFERVQ